MPLAHSESVFAPSAIIAVTRRGSAAHSPFATRTADTAFATRTAGSTFTALSSQCRTTDIMCSREVLPKGALNGLYSESIDRQPVATIRRRYPQWIPRVQSPAPLNLESLPNLRDRPATPTGLSK